MKNTFLIFFLCLQLQAIAQLDSPDMDSMLIKLQPVEVDWKMLFLKNSDLRTIEFSSKGETFFIRSNGESNLLDFVGREEELFELLERCLEGYGGEGK